MRRKLHGRTFISAFLYLLKDVSITLIDKTDASDSKKGENYWMRTLTTLKTDVLNVEGSV